MVISLVLPLPFSRFYFIFLRKFSCLLGYFRVYVFNLTCLEAYSMTERAFESKGLSILIDTRERERETITKVYVLNTNPMRVFLYYV